ncbi:uncharacterized protein G2W53_010901 [Senna tora]|uniref:Uncharacterized protein n=1 Tax=Senna tora TaxID=362788 RepID=A0A835CEL4_9FABA|nr:uncharacterized protein G2W53_010901 [Senna tora]
MEMCVNRDEGEARVWVLDYWCYQSNKNRLDYQGSRGEDRANAPTYPTTSSYHGIEMVLCDSEPDYGSIHHFGFNFVAADRIKSGELDQNILVDVILIGRVFNTSQVHPSSPNDPKTKRVTVDIDDSV